jgi:hypothetical protein
LNWFSRKKNTYSAVSFGEADPGGLGASPQ